MKRPTYKLFLLCGLLLVASALQYGCGKTSKPTSPSSMTEEQQAQAMQKQMEQAHVQNEAIKNNLEPYVQVLDGRFSILPGASEAVGARVVEAVQKNLTEMNTLAEKGEITISADRQVSRLRSAEASQVSGCWRGVRYNWWGLLVGMSSQDVSALSFSWKSSGGCTAVRNTLLSIPGAGPYIGTLAWVYCNVLAVNLSFFNCCICHGSCEVATIYWWALPTPFLDCQ